MVGWFILAFAVLALMVANNILTKNKKESFNKEEWRKKTARSRTLPAMEKRLREKQQAQEQGLGGYYSLGVVLGVVFAFLFAPYLFSFDYGLVLSALLVFTWLIGLLILYDNNLNRAWFVMITTFIYIILLVNHYSPPKLWGYQPPTILALGLIYGVFYFGKKLWRKLRK